MSGPTSNCRLRRCASPRNDHARTQWWGDLSRSERSIVATVTTFSRKRTGLPRPLPVCIPAVASNLRVGDPDATIASLPNYETDLAIMGRPPPDLSVEAQPFEGHPLVVTAAPDHLLVRGIRLKRHDFADDVFLVREEGSGTRTVFEEFMAELVLRRPRRRSTLAAGDDQAGGHGGPRHSPDLKTYGRGRSRERRAWPLVVRRDPRRQGARSGS